MQLLRFAGLPSEAQLESFSMLIQLALLLCYMMMLFIGAYAVSEASQRLLGVCGKGFVAGLLIPLLGCVSEATVILFSGVGPCAQVGLDIGIGTLGGSTIMLLTVPFFMSMFVARGDLDESGQVIRDSVDEKPVRQESCWKNGVNIGDDTHLSATVLGISAIPYVFMLIPSMVYRRSIRLEDGEEHWPAFACMLACSLFFMIYCLYYICDSVGLSKNRMSSIEFEEARALLSRSATPARSRTPGSVVTPAHELLLDASFDEESEHVLPDDGEDCPHNSDGSILPSNHFVTSLLLGGGVTLIVFFSGSSVAALHSVSRSAGVRPFFISFFVVPFAGSISETLTAVRLALRPNKEAVSIATAALYSAAAVNNLILLGIISGLVFFEKLEWIYASETIMILIVIGISTLVGLQKTIPIWQGMLMVCMLPLSVGLVAATAKVLNGKVMINTECHFG